MEIPDRTANNSKHSVELAPIVLTRNASDELPSGVGGFRLASHYSGEQSVLSRRQFTGKTILRLHDPSGGEVSVAISDILSISLAYVRSTGHGVVVPELYRPNLLVPVTGTLSSRNEHVHFERKCEPWVLFGRGTRETTTLPEKGAPYQAFVLSLPPEFLGNRLSRVEAHNGIVCGDVSCQIDLHLARLTLELATQVSISPEIGMEPHLANAWTTVVINQINRCLDDYFDMKSNTFPAQSEDLSLRYVQRAEKLMFERTNEIERLSDVAAHVGVSDRTLQAAFRKVRGAGPMRVLGQVRLQRARHALLDREGPKTVSDVCTMCGIDHHGRFSKQYKEAFGEYPISTLKARRAK